MVFSGGRGGGKKKGTCESENENGSGSREVKVKMMKVEGDMDGIVGMLAEEGRKGGGREKEKKGDGFNAMLFFSLHRIALHYIVVVKASARACTNLIFSSTSTSFISPPILPCGAGVEQEQSGDDVNFSPPSLSPSPGLGSGLRAGSISRAEGVDWGGGGGRRVEGPGIHAAQLLPSPIPIPFAVYQTQTGV